MNVLELKLVRYRDEHDTGYLYFWTERRDKVDVHISPMFESEQDAQNWYNDITQRLEECVSKLGRT